MRKKTNASILSIHNIAEKAGVSIATISRVINNKENVRQATRLKILNVINKYKYKPRLVKSKNLNIGILAQCHNEFIGHYLLEVVNGIFSYCIEYNYNLQLFSIHERRMQDAGIINTMRENKVDGICILLSNKDSSFIKIAEEEKFPYIVLNNIYSPNTNYIDIDNNEGIRLGLEHLYNLGHRKIVFLSGDLANQDHKDRYNAFIEHSKKMNIYNEKHIINFIDSETYLNSFELGYHQMEQVVKDLPDVTAIMTNNDDQAVGAIRTLAKNNVRIPQDISIMGFDNYGITQYFNPPLTTIQQPLFEMGRLAVAKLVAQLSAPSDKYIQIKLKPELIIRESTQALDK